MLRWGPEYTRNTGRHNEPPLRSHSLLSPRPTFTLPSKPKLHFLMPSIQLFLNLRVRHANQYSSERSTEKQETRKSCDEVQRKNEASDKARALRGDWKMNPRTSAWKRPFGTCEGGALLPSQTEVDHIPAGAAQNSQKCFCRTADWRTALICQLTSSVLNDNEDRVSPDRWAGGDGPSPNGGHRRRRGVDSHGRRHVGAN